MRVLLLLLLVAAATASRPSEGPASPAVECSVSAHHLGYSVVSTQTSTGSCGGESATCFEYSVKVQSPTGHPRDVAAISHIVFGTCAGSVTKNGQTYSSFCSFTQASGNMCGASITRQSTGAEVDGFTVSCGPDGSTGVYGLKFDAGNYDIGGKEDTFVYKYCLKGSWEEEDTHVHVKGGTGCFSSSTSADINGPACHNRGDDTGGDTGVENFAISGFVFHDDNCDEKLDASPDLGVGGMTVLLCSSAEYEALVGSGEACERSTVTSSTSGGQGFGFYQFTEVPGGAGNDWHIVLQSPNYEGHKAVKPIVGTQNGDPFGSVDGNSLSIVAPASGSLYEGYNFAFCPQPSSCPCLSGDCKTQAVYPQQALYASAVSEGTQVKLCWTGGQ